MKGTSTTSCGIAIRIFYWVIFVIVLSVIQAFVLWRMQGIHSNDLFDKGYILAWAAPILAASFVDLFCPTRTQKKDILIASSIALYVACGAFLSLTVSSEPLTGPWAHRLGAGLALSCIFIALAAVVLDDDPTKSTSQPIES